MSTALITMVKDEADVIVPFLRHHAWHVDAIYVADHGSTDGTRDLLANPPVPVTVTDLTDPGYWQSKYMTALAQQALADGHNWVVAADADEIWYVGSDTDRRIADYLCGVARDTLIVDAEMYHHVPTAEDREKEPNVFCRIGWRQRERGALPKVACRLHPELVIHPGNHGASLPGAGKAGSGLVIRHFPWRSAEHYIRKIRNGQAAYKATDLHPSMGAHWRAYEGRPDEEISDWFYQWGFSADPRSDRSLILDPAPVRGR